MVADDLSKIYGDADPVFTYDITQGILVDGDVFTGSLTREVGEDVGAYAIMQGSLALSTNYTLSFTGGMLDITPLQLIINAAPQTKVYGEADPVFTYELTDVTLQFDDAFTGALTREAGEDVGTYAILRGTLTAGDNYTYIYEGNSLSITPRALTATAESATKVYGDTDPVLGFNLTAGTLVEGDAFTGSLIREAGEDVGTYAVLQGTLSAGDNYTLTYIGDVFSISPRTLTVTAQPATKVYDEADPALSYTAGTLVSGDAFSGSLIREAGEDVGAYAILQGTLSAGDNYTLTYIGDVFSITPRALTVTAEPTTKVYGEADPALSYTAGTLVSGDAFSGSLIREAGEDVGTYAILQGTLSAGDNYTLTYIGDVFSITPRALTITAEPATKVYSEADPVLDYTLTEGMLIGGDVFSGSLTRLAGEDVGTYAISQGTVDINSNYTLTYEGADMVITPRDVTISADNQTKVYGEADPQLSWQLTQGSLIDGDAATGAPVRVAGEAVGVYAIRLGTLSFGDNYTMSYTEGELIITPKTLTIGGTFEVADKVYDGTTDAVITDHQLVLNGKVNDDEVALTNVIAVFAQAEPGTDIPVQLSQAQLTGTSADNYVLDDQNWPTITATIHAVTYTLSLEVTPADGGVVTGAGSYGEGATVSLTASPAEDYLFVRWEDNQGTELSTDTVYSFTMSGQDIMLTAVFQSYVSADQSQAHSIQLFPNPAREAVSIRSDGTITRLTIIDLGGRMVYDQPVHQQQVRVITSTFEPGIYLVKIYATDGVQIKKLQIQ